MQEVCPRCGKKFKNNSSVLNHMNQPISSCRTYYEELIQMNNTLSSPPSDPPQPTPSHVPQDFSSSPSTDHYMDTDVLNLTTQEDLPPRSPTPIFPFFKETHPTASTVYGRGQTFMDIFNKDEHSTKREQQLYYPFASRDEWELASFLLRSHLSMASIDKFLKLKLVSILKGFPQINS